MSLSEIVLESHCLVVYKYDSKLFCLLSFADFPYFLLFCFQFVTFEILLLDVCFDCQGIGLSTCHFI